MMPLETLHTASRIFATLNKFRSAAAALIGRDEPEPITGADYQNPNLPTEERVEDILGHMTLDEKLNLMAAPRPIWRVVTGMFSTFETSKSERLGIPPFAMHTIRAPAERRKTRRLFLLRRQEEHPGIGI